MTPSKLIIILALVTTSCAHVPGETLTSGTRQHAISGQVLDLSKQARPDCRRHNVTDSEIVDLHPDGKVAIERWTVTRCGERARYVVTLPGTGRGTGFLVKPEKQ